MQVGVLDDGQVCQFEGCLENDLLPAKCTNCQKMFCSEHILSSSHNCHCMPDARLPHCPMCNVVVPMLPGQSADEAVSLHLNRRCVPPLKTSATVSSPTKNSVYPSRSGAKPVTQNPLPSRLPPSGISAAGAAALARHGRGSKPVHQGGGTSKSTHSLGTSSGAPTTGSLQGKAETDPTDSPMWISLSNLLLQKANNTPSSAVGRPLGVAIEKNTAIWVPLVHFIISSTQSDESSDNTDHITEEKSTPKKKTERKESELSSSTISTSSSFLRVPPLYVYGRKTYTLGKVLDTVFESIETYHSCLSSASSFFNPSLVPHYFFVVHANPPRGATAAMYPPHSLTTLVGKVENTSSSEKKISLASGALVFVSNCSTLPEDLFKILQRRQAVPEPSTCSIC